MMAENKVHIQMRLLPDETEFIGDGDDKIMVIRGVAATTVHVFEGTEWEEYFTASALRERGNTLVGKPVIDWHSDFPYKVRVKDIFGQVISTEYDETNEALRFEAEIWDPTAQQVMQRQMYKHFSVDYAEKFKVNDAGVREVYWVDFKDLGYLNEPADEGATLDGIVRIEKRELEIEPICIDGICDIDNKLRRNHLFLQMAYRHAQRNGSWGDYLPDDIFIKIQEMREKMGMRIVKKDGDEWCVFESDGTTKINCYSITDLGDQEAKDKAQAQLAAIEISKAEDRANGEGPFSAGPGGECVCPDCGYEVKHNRNESCSDMKCPDCGTELVRKEVNDSERTDGPPNNIGGDEANHNDQNNTSRGDNMNTEDEEEEEEQEEDVSEEQPNPDTSKEEPETSEDEEESKDKKEKKKKESEDSEAESDEDEEEESDEESDEEESEPDEERAEKDTKPLSVREAITQALEASEEQDKDPAVVKLREAMAIIEEREAPPATKEMRELKNQLAESQKKVDEFEAAKREREVTDRVTGLISDCLYKPADEKGLREIVGPMDDETFKKFREIEKGKPAWSKKEMGRMDDDDEEETDEQKKERESKAEGEEEFSLDQKVT